ncbi:MAG: hypothetical protein M0D57_00630 [Sphingobacteriales bacterium JAD_PAG50586_3]|nr:MAG: hypothetical protein M0D57_00630 [Sphingobacteriales bacterium JAD_PAG50586_3]
MFRSVLAVLTVVFLFACEKESAEPQYNFEVPAYFPAKHYNMPFNAKQFELGRKLFTTLYSQKTTPYRVEAATSNRLHLHT